MTDSFIIFLTEMFFKRQKDGKDEFLMIGLSLPMNYLHGLYNKLIQADVPPIETLSNEEKTKYWEIAKRYYEDKDSAIKASKAIYLLTLITNS